MKSIGNAIFFKIEFQKGFEMQFWKDQNNFNEMLG